MWTSSRWIANFHRLILHRWLLHHCLPAALSPICKDLSRRLWKGNLGFVEYEGVFRMEAILTIWVPSHAPPFYMRKTPELTELLLLFRVRKSLTALPRSPFSCLTIWRCYMIATSWLFGNIIVVTESFRLIYPPSALILDLPHWVTLWSYTLWHTNY